MRNETETMAVAEALRRRAADEDREGDAVGFALVVLYDDGSIGTSYGGDRIAVQNALPKLQERIANGE